MLKLLYKSISEPDCAEVTCAELLSAVEWIFRVVHGINAPRASPLFTEVERAIGSSPADPVKWRG